MDVEFCPCGAMMIPVSDSLLRCRACGREIKKHLDMKLQTHIDAKGVKQSSRKEDIVIIENNEPDLPKTDKVCPKCKNEEAYYWLIQTRSIDEPPTQFFRCVKCKHVWREYK